MTTHIAVHTDKPMTPRVLARIPQGLVMEFGPYIATLENLDPASRVAFLDAFGTVPLQYLPAPPFPSNGPLRPLTIDNFYPTNGQSLSLALGDTLYTLYQLTTEAQRALLDAFATPTTPVWPGAQPYVPALHRP